MQRKALTLLTAYCQLPLSLTHPGVNGQELPRIEAGAADEEAVDGAVLDEVGDVVGGDAAAVENRRVGEAAGQKRARALRISTRVSATSAPLASRPVPMAQMGS